MTNLPALRLEFLGVSFIEASAAVVLLVLYWMMASPSSGRFFRSWVIGWTVYVLWGCCRVAAALGRQSWELRLTPALSMLAWLMLFAAILEFRRHAWPAKLSYPLGIALAAGLCALGYLGPAFIWERTADMAIESALNLGSAWILWRSPSRYRSAGWKILLASLILRGLQGSFRLNWQADGYLVFRMAVHSILGIAVGVGMALLVLESGRIRTEELNEKLRRLALIAAQAMQSLRVSDTLAGILRHLVESLGGSYGVIYLLDDTLSPKALVLRADTNLDEGFRSESARAALNEPWVQETLKQEAPVSSSIASLHHAAARWTGDAKITSTVTIRIPGKETPLGILAIGLREERSLQPEEEQFLVNVANLLGLTVQNVTLFESAATSRRQWLDTFDSIDDLILVHSPDGKILRANRALAVRLGAAPQALHRKLMREVFRSGDTPWKLCPYCEGIAGRPEKRDLFFNGYFLASDSAFNDSDGNRLGTIHVLKDFTSRLQAESKFRTLFEKVREGVFIATPEGRLLDFNDAFMRMLGYENREELLQEELPRLYVDSADRGRLLRMMREYGEANGFEFQFRRKDGEIRSAVESSFVTRDEAGTITGYQGFILDTTEHKQAEMNLRRRNRELLTLNSIAELLSQEAALTTALAAVLPKLIKLLTVDASAVHLLDESSKSLRLAAASGFVADLPARFAQIDFPSPLMQQFLQARPLILSGSAPALPEALRELNRAAGLQASQVAVLWSKDRIMGILTVGCREPRAFSPEEINLLSAVANQVATTVDKAVLLQKTQDAYHTLRQTQEQLLQSEKMAAVGQLISGVAHELNNPLTAILGYSQLLRSGELSGSRTPEFLDKLHKQAQRTHRIVENLLSFGRQHKPERKPVQLNQILEDTLTLREYDLRGSHIVVHRDFDPYLPLSAVDFHQLQQVFLNLLNNAVDAIREQGEAGEIWIHTEAAGDQLRVEITDSGPGVKNPSRVFDPFYTTKPVGKGTGLGLSICYGIVKEHGGEIQVSNSPPRGATFTILLPVHSAERGRNQGPSGVAEGSVVTSPVESN